MNKIIKNQHYVPQMLLRGFCIANTKQINSYDLYSSLFSKESIRSICSGDFFYDEQNEFENILSQIEGSAGKIIDALRKGIYQLLTDDKNKEFLIMFIVVQMYRTNSAKLNGLARIDNLQMSLVKDLLVKNFGDVDNYGYFKYDEDDKRNIIQINLTLATLMSLGMLDLKIHILESESNATFILSDNPAVMYNYIFSNTQHPISSSPFASGTMIFLPISNSKCICLYDSSIYKLGKIRNRISTIIHKQDVELLNQLQVKNDAKKIFYINHNNIGALIHQYSKSKQLYKEECSSNGEYICIGKILIHKSQKPEFFTILKRNTTIPGYRPTSKEWLAVLSSFSKNPKQFAEKLNEQKVAMSHT